MEIPKSHRTPVQRYRLRHKTLESERSSYDSHWRDVADHFSPRRFRIDKSERNNGTKKNDKIINGTPILATRRVTAGMQFGMTPPSRPWFRLLVGSDPEMTKSRGVKVWLEAVENEMYRALARSNFYLSTQTVYGDLIRFGTAVMHVDEDAEDVFRCYVVPPGQYCLANSHRMRVEEFFRRYQYTTRQIIDRFGIENVSMKVREAAQQDNWEQVFDVIHVIEKRLGRDYAKADSKNMPWKSCWFEADVPEHQKDFYLRESGYNEFPVMAPRWEVTDGDTYGHGPAMDALGDTRALQVLERRKAQAIDKLVNPPMVGPAVMAMKPVSMLPGAMNFSDGSANEKFRPAIEVDPRGIQFTGAEIQRYEQRVLQLCYADLWLSITEQDGKMTAREIQERHEEKLQQLGPALERLHDEFLDPFIDRIFGVMFRAGMLPPPPPELEGQDLKVDYISSIAQAQKMIGIAAIERTASFTAQLSTLDPMVVHKVNAEKVVDAYANAVGISPDLVRSDEEMAQIRADAAAKAKAQEQGQALLAATQGAKNLAGSDLETDNALSRLIGGTGAPQPPGGQQ